MEQVAYFRGLPQSPTFPSTTLWWALGVPVLEPTVANRLSPRLPLHQVVVGVATILLALERQAGLAVEVPVGL